MKNQNSSIKRARINRMYGTDDIPSRAKIVYLYLEDRCYTSSECFPAIGTICTSLNLSRSTVKRALADLEKAGLISKEQRFRPDGGCTSNNYVLTD